jgi:hypothetical protein
MVERTIVSLTTRSHAAARSAGHLVAGLIGPAALSGILVSVMVLAARAMAFLYEEVKSWGGREDV